MNNLDLFFIMAFRMNREYENFGHHAGPSYGMKTHEGHMERTFVRFSSAMRHRSFRLACGHGSRTAFRCDAFAERVIGIPLACRIGSAIDGGESLRKSASLVNFGGVVFVPTSKFLPLLPLSTCWCKKIDVGRGVQGIRKNDGFSDLAHGLQSKSRETTSHSTRRANH